MIKIKRCLISVSDKEGIVDFAKALSELKIEIIASSGTAKLLKDSGIDVILIDEITGFPEILGGRVKTLHPVIHSGILAKREKEHLDELERHNIKPIDMVVCNLYPFEEKIKEQISQDEAIEEIDIGGVSLIRAGAKNYKYVATIVDKGQYQRVLDILKENGGIPEEFSYSLAKAAFAYIAHYDTVISDWFLSRAQNNGFLKDKFPDVLNISLKKVYELRYGENPHQKGAFYVKEKPEFAIIQGELSYNNILDTSSAWGLACEFKEPACVIIKHNNPCGVALSDDLYSAYRLAFEADPISAFGGIIGVNRCLDLKTATAISKTFYEGIIAPDFEEGVKGIFLNKKIRLIKGAYKKDKICLRSALSGFLLQEKDIENYKNLYFPTKKKPTDDELEDLIFAYCVCKYVTSNAIVIARNKKTLGICGGQTNRVSAVKIACERAKEKVSGSCLASDGFFPFQDSIDVAGKYGVSAIIEPGGSIRDKEVIEAADSFGISLVFANIRHFKH